MLRQEWINTAYSDEDFDPSGPPVIIGNDVAAQGDDETGLLVFRMVRLFFVKVFRKPILLIGYFSFSEDI